MTKQILVYLGLMLVISPCFSYTPKANPKAIVQVAPNARFTILTSRLIRMEWAPADHSTREAEFNDGATFAFINRYMEDDEVPKYTVSNTGEEGVTIKTDYITVCFLLCIKNNTLEHTQYVYLLSSQHDTSSYKILKFHKYKKPFSIWHLNC